MTSEDGILETLDNISVSLQNLIDAARLLDARLVNIEERVIYLESDVARIWEKVA